MSNLESLHGREMSECFWGKQNLPRRKSKSCKQAAKFQHSSRMGSASCKLQNTVLLSINLLVSHREQWEGEAWWSVKGSGFGELMGGSEKLSNGHFEKTTSCNYRDLCLLQCQDARCSPGSLSRGDLREAKHDFLLGWRLDDHTHEGN